jgi:preprotein translocase subunit SecA
VVELGGLYVIGTNRHESLRVDRQLRGRAGRQGDPGSSRFFISFEDPLIERYGIAELLPARQRQVRRQDPISSPVVRRTIATGQRIVEGESFAIRRRLWRYSELMDRQRSWMQTRRRSLLRGDKKPGLLRRRCPEPWAAALEKVGEDGLSEIERRITLLMIDRCWSDYLALMTSVRDGIHVVGLVGKDPLAEFYRETGEAFEDLQVRVEEAVVETFGRVTITDRGIDWEKEGLLGPSSTWTYLVNDTPFGANPLRSLANRPGLALFGVLVLGPLLFLWGIREHWRKRRGRKCR